MKNACFLLPFCCFLKMSLAQDVTIAGFADSVITVDGNANEWSVPFRFSDYTSKLQYNFRNDSSTLYFVFKADDALAKVKVLRYGFDIYIDTTGKKKKTEHLQFPMKYVHKQNEEPQAAVTTQYEAEQLQLRMKRDVDAMLVENFVGVENGIKPLKNEFGIQAAIDFDSLSSLVYEISIPIKLIQVKPTCEKTPWSITFNLNAPQAAMNIGRGGETLNKNRDGEGNFTNQSAATNDIDSDPYGTGASSMLGGGMGGIGAGGMNSVYGSGMNGMGAGSGMLGGMGSGGMNGMGGGMGMGAGGMGGGSGMNGMGGGANMQMPQMKQTNPAFQSSEWKFKFRLAK